MKLKDALLKVKVAGPQSKRAPVDDTVTFAIEAMV